MLDDDDEDDDAAADDEEDDDADRRSFKSVEGGDSEHPLILFFPFAFSYLHWLCPKFPSTLSHPSNPFEIERFPPLKGFGTGEEKNPFLPPFVHIGWKRLSMESRA